MMKANELRIGNYVKHNSEWCYRGADTSVFQWSESDWYALGECTLFLENIEPIPLTEDWLLSFGFKKDKLEVGLYHYGDFELMLPTYFKWKDSHINKIKHVHHLQNLIFALTGKELKRVEE